MFKWITMLVIVCFLLPEAACEALAPKSLFKGTGEARSNTELAARVLKNAVQRMKENKFNAAMQLYQVAVLLDPLSNSALAGLADIYSSSGYEELYREAVDVVDYGLSITPHDFILLEIKARALVNLQDPSAEAILREILLRDPTRIKALRSLIALYIHRGQHELAFATLGWALASAKEPDEERKFWLMISALFKLRDDFEFSKMASGHALGLPLDRLLASKHLGAMGIIPLAPFSKLEPGSEEMQEILRIAHGHAEQGNFQRCFLMLDRVSKLAPDDPAVWAALADNYFFQQRVLRAKQEQLSLTLGQIELFEVVFVHAADSMESAIRAAKQGLALNTEHPRLLASAADIFSEHRMWDELPFILDRAMKVAPNDVRVLRALLRDQIHNEKPNAGLATARRLLELSRNKENWELGLGLLTTLAEQLPYPDQKRLQGIVEFNRGVVPASAEEWDSFAQALQSVEGSP